MKMKQHKSILQIFIILCLCFLADCGKESIPSEIPTTQPAYSYISPLNQSVSISPLATPVSVPPPPTSTATFTTTPTHTATQTPPSTNTPEPTNTPRSPDEEIDRILNNVRWEGGIEASVIGAVRAMDYLMRYPDSPYREEISTQVFWASPRFFKEWFNPIWLDQYVHQPFNNERGMPVGFDQKWQDQNMMQIFVTDLDGNNIDDFVIAIKHILWWGTSDGGLYWLHGEPGDYDLSVLPTGEERIGYETSLYTEVRAIKDLNNNGMLELVYIIPTTGASSAFEAIHILSWEDGKFKNMVVGDNLTRNGEWTIEDKDGNGIFELGKKQGGTGSAGTCCFLNYELEYELRRGEYIPSRQIPGDSLGEGNNPGWQAAKMFQYSYNYVEALGHFNALLLERRNLEYYQETIPYVLFQIGMTQLLMNNADEANETWALLAKDFSGHPVTLDVLDMKSFLQNRDGIWQACNWLRNDKRDWPLSEDKLVFFQLEADYNNWGGLCDPRFLFGQWEWSQNSSLDTQLVTRGLNWHNLSEAFDLNSDNRIDPIGEIKLAGGAQRWVFLTQDDNTYTPLFADSPYPVEAIHIWDKFGYDEMPWYVKGHDVRVTDIDEDGNPEMRYTNPSGNYSLETEWIGHRFEKIDNKITINDFTVLEFSDDVTLTNILKTLFYEQNFEKAIKLLESYDSNSDPSINQAHFEYWAEGGRYFLTGLAYSYLGETELAQQFFFKVIQDYADTSWVDLAREKVGPKN